MMRLSHGSRILEKAALDLSWKIVPLQDHRRAVAQGNVEGRYPSAAGMSIALVAARDRATWVARIATAQRACRSPLLGSGDIHLTFVGS